MPISNKIKFSQKKSRPKLYLPARCYNKDAELLYTQHQRRLLGALTRFKFMPGYTHLPIYSFLLFGLALPRFARRLPLSSFGAGSVAAESFAFGRAIAPVAGSAGGCSEGDVKAGGVDSSGCAVRRRSNARFCVSLSEACPPPAAGA